ncbi:hypothetical protein M8C21_030565 [Ambrosia artemisiifolia]|uniref:ABC transporter B family member 28 n=1 Tax=Ambrosia artemisiifolia TaxID=4212 RepID=A0AAD5GBZ8_AMBAR|nr:hypothetical protein M8C21_030565 [Ambrosia artemisiifolia]
MASLPLFLPLHPSTTTTNHHHCRRPLITHRRQPLTHHRSLLTPTYQHHHLRPTNIHNKPNFTTTSAYITGPASDAIVSSDDPKVDDVVSGSIPVPVQQFDAISLGLLFRLLSRHKLRIAASVASLVCCTTCTLSMPILSGRFFEVLIGARAEPLWQLLSKVAVLYTLEPIFTVIFVVNMNTIWEKVMSSLRAQIFGSVLIHKVDFFDKYKVGELTALLTSDLGSFKNIVIGTMCLLFVLAPQLAPILGVLMLAVSVLVAVYKRSTVKVFKAYGLTQASIADCVTETFSAIRTVRSFGGEKRQMLTFGNQVLEYQKSGIQLGVYKSINESITRVAVYVSLLALYILGGNKVKAVQGLVNTIGDLRGAFAATERINSILSGSEIDQALAYAASSVRSLASSGDICLEDVHFAYPLRPDVEVLNGLDLTLKCGTVTALVGSSGAGKSTVPTQGRITVAGEDLRTFDKSEWARIVSIVNQEPVLFSVSVGENIAYGLPDEHGYDTLVGERGGLLSGGQRQRVAIARALLKNAPILILDEATSALDAVSERLVQDALNRLMKGRTTLVIAHRLSTVQNADQIAVCSEGKIAELGTHAELLAKKGDYASLVGSQRLAFE